MSKSVTDMTPEERAKVRQEGLERWETEKSDFFLKNSNKMKTYFQGVPKSYQRGWLRSVAGNSSRTGAIKAKCYDCSGYQAIEVTLCNVTTCPLWHFRPGKDKLD